MRKAGWNMALVKYAVISIGSYELELKLYQITADKKIKTIENVRQDRKSVV